MESVNLTFLFGDYTIAMAGTGQSQYGHTFGGPHDRKGTAREDCNGVHIHLLHRLNLSDPAIPIKMPGLNWLPLYYCFDFRVNELGYHLVSDDQLVTFIRDDDPHVTDHEKWPEDDFPLEFPQSSIKIAPSDYDPTKLDDAQEWAGVFGIGKLSKKNQAALRTRVAEEYGLDDPITEEEEEEYLYSPFPQARPYAICMNPRCPGREEPELLTPIALVMGEPVKGVHIFGKYGDGVQLIFQLCKKCNSVLVCNQCT